MYPVDVLYALNVQYRCMYMYMCIHVHVHVLVHVTLLFCIQVYRLTKFLFSPPPLSPLPLHLVSQGVKAELKEAEARSLKARLKTSEDNAELLKTFSSPQVGYPFMVNSRTVTKAKGSDGRPPKPIPLDWGTEAPAKGRGGMEGQRLKGRGKEGWREGWKDGKEWREGG